MGGMDGRLPMAYSLAAWVEQQIPWTITCSRRAGGRAASDSLSRYAEIGYFGHEVFVKQDILGFQVTMNHTVLA